MATRYVESWQEDFVDFIQVTEWLLFDGLLQFEQLFHMTMGRVLSERQEERKIWHFLLLFSGADAKKTPAESALNSSHDFPACIVMLKNN